MTTAALAVVAQQAVVDAAVLACAVYAAWTLAPADMRRPVARFLVRRRWLAGWPALRAASRSAGSGCACDGCDRGRAGAVAGNTSPTGAAQVIRIVARD